MASSVIGVIVFMAIVIVVIPMVMKFMKGMNSGGGAGSNYAQKFCQLSGLTQGTDDFTGTYKGYSFRVKSEMGADYMQMIQRRGIQIYPKLTVTLTSQGSNYPFTVLREEHSFLVETNQKINNMITGKNIQLPQAIPSLKKRLPRISGVYSNDQVFAEKLVADQELAQLLNKWFYADIRIQSDTVVLVLDHENAPRHFGMRMASPQYWVDAMDICARIADIVKT